MDLPSSLPLNPDAVIRDPHLRAQAADAQGTVLLGQWAVEASEAAAHYALEDDAVALLRAEQDGWTIAHHAVRWPSAFEVLQRRPHLLALRAGEPGAITVAEMLLFRAPELAARLVRQARFAALPLADGNRLGHLAVAISPEAAHFALTGDEIGEIRNGAGVTVRDVAARFWTLTGSGT